MPFNVNQHIDELKKLRQHLHSIAEVSGEEEETADFVTNFLKETNPDQLKTDIGGYGIAASYNGPGEGPHILIRCELDGLPIYDDIDAEYRSKTEGVGHKCGHDGHMTIVCGVAKVLKDNPPERGKVTLLFQPAEETGEGARCVIGDPVFQQYSPDYCFALHNLPGYKKHQIVLCDGVFSAASVGLIANFEGSTAHASHPEQGKSPALAMAQTVQAFSSLPQFYTPLEKAAKVTVVSATLGEKAFGTSPGKAKVMATLRTYDKDLLDKLKEKCLQIAEKTADTYELSFDCEWVESFPITKNSSEGYQFVKSAAEKLNYDILFKPTPFSWSEDFGHFTNQFEGAIFGLGVGENHPSLHAEQYDFSDDVLPTGISMFMQIINEVTAE